MTSNAITTACASHQCLHCGISRLTNKVVPTNRAYVRSAQEGMPKRWRRTVGAQPWAIVCLFAARLRRVSMICLLLLKLRVRRRFFSPVRMLRPPPHASSSFLHGSQLCGADRQPPQLRPVRKPHTLLPQKIR